MRIISKFHDYYDCAMAQGIDTSLIYKRDREFVAFEAPAVDAISSVRKLFDDYPFSLYGYEFGTPLPAFLLFCGRAYPFWLRPVDTFRSVNKALDESIFSEILTLEGMRQRIIQLFARRHTFRIGWETRLTDDPFFPGEDAVDEFNQPLDGNAPWDKDRFVYVNLLPYVESVSGSEVGSNIHHVIGSPVALLTRCRFSGNERQYAALRNPCLKDLDFVRIIDPFTAYQEIAMFLGGVMARADEAPLRVGSDEVIARQKGFDEWSFRTMSPGQKKLNRKANRERKRGG